MGSTPSPPPVPQASNIIQADAAANRINQSTPFANLTYSQSPGGAWNVTQNYSPQVMAGINSAFNTAQSAMPGVTSNLSKFNAQKGPADPSQAITQALAMENKYMAPWFQQEQSNLDAKLQNGGFSINDPAYQNAQRDLQNNQTNWVGGNVAQFEPIAFQQSQQKWMDPLIAAQGNLGVAQGALGIGQGYGGLGSGSYVSTPQTDVNGAFNTQTQAQQYDYGQQMQNHDAMLGGLFSIPAAAMGGWAKNGFSFGGR